MSTNRKNMIILVADDDQDDRLLIKEAFMESKLSFPMHFVEDGLDLLDYLKRRDKYAGLAGTPLPGLILLDLNMPRKNGIEALQDIKADSNLRKIPILIFTTSKAEEDIQKAYNMGVNSFISKPLSFESMINIVSIVSKYWFQIVELPI